MLDARWHKPDSLQTSLGGRRVLEHSRNPATSHTGTPLPAPVELPRSHEIGLLSEDRLWAGSPWPTLNSRFSELLLMLTAFQPVLSLLRVRTRTYCPTLRKPQSAPFGPQLHRVAFFSHSILPLLGPGPASVSPMVCFCFV